MEDTRVLDVLGECRGVVGLLAMGSVSDPAGHVGFVVVEVDGESEDAKDHNYFEEEQEK